MEVIIKDTTIEADYKLTINGEDLTDELALDVAVKDTQLTHTLVTETMPPLSITINDPDRGCFKMSAYLDKFSNPWQRGWSVYFVVRDLKCEATHKKEDNP